MNSFYRPLSLTIVDFLGTLLPGVIWLALVSTAVNLASGSNPASSTTPMTAVSKAFLIFNDGGAVHLMGLLVLAFVCGMLPRTVAMSWTEFLARGIPLILLGKRSSYSQLVFPYNGLFNSTPLFREVESIIKLHSNLDVKELPGNGAFSYCKRFLKVTSLELCEESERREAEVRMTGSLILASIVSVLLSLAALLEGLNFVEFLRWSGISVGLGLLFVSAFRRKRMKEVEYVYLNTVVASAAKKFAGSTSYGVRS